MWSRIISWILAAITSLMNGFGMYTQEYKPFTSQAEYTIQEEAVDYAQLRGWYISSYGGSGSCKIERNPGEGERNKMGFYWIVRGGKHNPDAKIEFESGTVIVAPNSGKITNSPNSSGNKIIFANDEKGFNACRMEIIKPERWYCCIDAEPLKSGHYAHSNGDHRIELSQGDAICVAGPETSIKLYRGNNEGVLKECSTLREFLLYTDAEGGDPSLNISTGGDLKPGKQEETEEEGIQVSGDKVPGIDNAPIYTGGGSWHQWADNSGRWWYGTDTEWAAGQYVFVNNNWYYFSDDGTMIVGWGSDDHFYVTADMATSAHPEGSMALNTIVPMNGYSDRYVHVSGTTGFNNTEESAESVTAHNRTYVKSGDYYVVASYGDGNTAIGSGGDSANSGGGSDSSTQGGTNGQYFISEEDWDTLRNGGNISGGDRWVNLDGEWMYVRQGRSITAIGSDWRAGGYMGYEIGDTWYLFNDDGTLFTDEGPVQETDGNEYWVYNKANDAGLARGESVDYNGETLYADRSCYLHEGSSSGPFWDY